MPVLTPEAEGTRSEVVAPRGGDRFTRRTRQEMNALAHEEVQRLVQTYLQRGGKITVCPPGDAMVRAGSFLADRLRRVEALAKEE